MNTVLIVVGALTAAGAVLTRAVWPRRRVTAVGVGFVVLAGVGGVLVGLAPADLRLAVNGAGALLQVPGAVGPLLLGEAAWSGQRPVAAFSLVCGVVGSAASLLYFSPVYLGLGLWQVMAHHHKIIHTVPRHHGMISGPARRRRAALGA